MNESITFTIGIPDKILSPNARPHWAQKRRATKDLRECSKYLTLQAMAGRNIQFTEASMFTTWHWKDKRSRDRDNALARMKAVQDGIADAGLVKNDRDIWPECPVFGEPDKHNPRVIVTICARVANRATPATSNS